jgi:MFS family permease
MAASVSLVQPSLITISILIIMGSMLGGLYRPTLDVLVADHVGPEKRAEAYSLQRIAGNLGFALGPMIGGLAATLSYTILFLVTAACNLATFFLILAFIVEPKVKRSGEKFKFTDMASVAKDRPFLAHSITSLVLFIVSSQLMVTLSVFSIKNVGISKIEMGTLFTLNGAMIVLLQYGVTALFNRVRLTTALATGASVYAFGYLTVGFAASYYHLLLSMAIITLGELIAMPSATTLVANLAPADKRGRYMGFFGLSTETGHSIGPFIGGMLMDASAGNHLVLWGPIWVTGLCASIGYLILGRQLEKKKRV